LNFHIYVRTRGKNDKINAISPVIDYWHAA